MENESIKPGTTQADFIREEMNFNIDPNNPLVQASMTELPAEEWIDILGNKQLMKRVLIAGKPGTRPTQGDTCVLNIAGRLYDGSIVESEEDIEIILGDVEVVQGLDLAIALMNFDEVAEVEVASRFAYGDLGKLPNIPPGVTMYYTVELKEIKPERDIDSLSIEERKSLGNKKRERGNWWFNRNESTLAIQCYRRALEYLNPLNNTENSKFDEESYDSPELQDLLKERTTVYNNLAAAQIKTEAYDAALQSVEYVLSREPENVKALFRKGKILHYKGKHSAAYTVIQQAAKLDPETKVIQLELAILKEKKEKDAQFEKILYKKMLGSKGSDNETTDILNKTDSNRNASAFMWSLIGGVAAIIGVVVYKFTS